jgi:regulator of sigma E protease
MVALYDRGLFTKLLVFTAGVFFNFLAAIAATTMLYSIGYNEPRPGPAVVDEVPPNPPWPPRACFAATPSLRWTAARSPISSKPAKPSPRSRNPAAAPTAFASPSSAKAGESPSNCPRSPRKPLPEFFKPWAWRFEPYVGGTIPFKPAARAGIKAGDLIVAVEDQPVEAWSQATALIRANPDSALKITVLRRGETEPRDFIVVSQEDPAQPGTGIIGIGLGTGYFERIQDPFLVALARAPERTWNELARIAILNYRVLTQASFREIREGVGGPVAIATITFERAKGGFIPALEWFITLNLILAIMNLLPIPVLDGGFIVLSVIEAVMRRPVPTPSSTPSTPSSPSASSRCSSSSPIRTCSASSSNSFVINRRTRFRPRGRASPLQVPPQAGKISGFHPPVNGTGIPMTLIAGPFSGRIWRAVDSLPPHFDELVERNLPRHAFKPVNAERGELRSIGWVNIRQLLDTRLTLPKAMFDGTLALGLRIDKHHDQHAPVQGHAHAGGGENREGEEARETLPRGTRRHRGSGQTEAHPRPDPRHLHLRNGLEPRVRHRPVHRRRRQALRRIRRPVHRNLQRLHRTPVPLLPRRTLRQTPAPRTRTHGDLPLALQPDRSGAGP